MFTATAYCT